MIKLEGGRNGSAIVGLPSGISGRPRGALEAQRAEGGISRRAGTSARHQRC